MSVFVVCGHLFPVPFLVFGGPLCVGESVVRCAGASCRRGLWVIVGVWRRVGGGGLVVFVVWRYIVEPWRGRAGVISWCSWCGLSSGSVAVVVGS